MRLEFRARLTDQAQAGLPDNRQVTVNPVALPAFGDILVIQKAENTKPADIPDTVPRTGHECDEIAARAADMVDHTKVIGTDPRADNEDQQTPDHFDVRRLS